MQPTFKHVQLHAQEQCAIGDKRFYCACFNDKQSRDWFIFSTNMSNTMVAIFGRGARLFNDIPEVARSIECMMMDGLKDIFPTTNLHIWHNHEFVINNNVASFTKSPKACTFAFQVEKEPADWKQANERWGTNYIKLNQDPRLLKLMLELEPLFNSLDAMDKPQSPPSNEVWHANHPLGKLYQSMQKIRTARTIFDENTRELLVFPSQENPGYDKKAKPIRLTPHTQTSYLIHFPCGCVEEHTFTSASEFALCLLKHVAK